MFEQSASEKLTRDIERLGKDMMEIKKQIGLTPEKMHEWQEGAQEKWEEVRDVAMKSGKNLDKHVHENPWMSIAAALVIGAVVGLLSSHKSRHD